MAYTVINGRLVKTKHAQRAIQRNVNLRADTPVPPNKPDKGLFGGSCNRRACQRPGADWFNHSTRRYYCRSCAHTLNTDPFNARDAQEMYGHQLCTEGKHEGA